METQDTQESSELILYTVMARYGAWRSSSKKFISEMGTYLFYRIVAYGVIERLLAIFVIRNKKYKISTGLLFFEINLTYLLKINFARDIRYDQKTKRTSGLVYFLAVFSYIQQCLLLKKYNRFSETRVQYITATCNRHLYI